MNGAPATWQAWSSMLWLDHFVRGVIRIIKLRLLAQSLQIRHRLSLRPLDVGYGSKKITRWTLISHMKLTLIVFWGFGWFCPFFNWKTYILMSWSRYI